MEPHEDLGQWVLRAVKISDRNIQDSRDLLGYLEGWRVYPRFVATDPRAAASLVQPDQNAQAVLRQPGTDTGSAKTTTEQRFRASGHSTMFVNWCLRRLYVVRSIKLSPGGSYR